MAVEAPESAAGQVLIRAIILIWRHWVGTSPGVAQIAAAP